MLIVRLWPLFALISSKSFPQDFAQNDLDKKLEEGKSDTTTRWAKISIFGALKFVKI